MFSDGLTIERITGKPFSSVKNNFIQHSGFEIRYPPASLYKKMVIAVAFAQKMIRHFKIKKIPLLNTRGTPNTLVC